MTRSTTRQPRLEYFREMEVNSMDLNLGCRWCGEIHKPAAQERKFWGLEGKFRAVGKGRISY